MTVRKREYTPTEEKPDGNEGELILVDEPNTIDDLPLSNKQRRKDPQEYTTPAIEVHRIPDTEDVLVSIKPPQQPLQAIEHVPCDIILVIDVSSSMNASADLPHYSGGEQQESSGLSILDLVKHASRTVIESLNAGDRLAVVTFSNDATIIQDLLPMTIREKEVTLRRIEALNAGGNTNLWSGIHKSFRLFEDVEGIGNVQRVFVLTDGAPNHMCPSQGYVQKLQPMLKKGLDASESAPTISTFGFGYRLRSALLRSIAEVGSGNYAFIPDAGMIGTVFVHAVANLFSTFATDATVTVECARVDSQVMVPAYLDFANQALASNITCLSLGNIQFGQSRNIIFTVQGLVGKQTIKATLRYRHADKIHTVTTDSASTEICSLSRPVIDYHYSRHDICGFLAALSTKDVRGEHVNLRAVVVQKQAPELKSLISNVQRRCDLAQKNNVSSTELADLKSLLHDLKPADADNADLHGMGQISLALQAAPSGAAPTDRNMACPPHLREAASTKTYYERWGQHYLASILHAHMFQLCLTFKDSGPLRYGVNSPLFTRCRDRLDRLFDDLPAPKPDQTRVRSSDPYWTGSASSTTVSTPIRMSRWNNVSNPCFSAKSIVEMATRADNPFAKTVEQVRVGDRVQTKAGPRSVRAIVKTQVSQQMMYTIRDDEDEKELSITPWHPVFYQGQWRFPAKVRDLSGKVLPYSIIVHQSIYSFMLEKEENPDAHTMRVGGYWSLTLGHGILTDDTEHDARAHTFFGDYDRVLQSLERLAEDEHRRRISGGVARMKSQYGIGLACGFLSPEDVDCDRGEARISKGL